MKHAVLLVNCSHSAASRRALLDACLSRIWKWRGIEEAFERGETELQTMRPLFPPMLFA
jgi:hypothetical protein